MIFLDIQFLSSLRTMLGKDRITIKIDSKDFTVRDLITKLDDELGQNFRDLIINNKINVINPEILIFVNSKEIQTLEKLNTPLTNGNHIVFVSSIHGGFINSKKK